VLTIRVDMINCWIGTSQIDRNYITWLYRKVPPITANMKLTCDQYFWRPFIQCTQYF